MNERTALLVGATGLVGSHCLQFLLEGDAYEKVVVILRRPFPLTHPKLEHRIVDFNKLDQFAQAIEADDIYCCLGTTIKVAGSQDAFRLVDQTYPVQIGAIGAKNGAQQFLVVSALGADPRSKIFYNRVKGEMEEAISKLPFEAVHIFRPSLLLGERRKFRLGETIGNAVIRPFTVLMAGPLKKYKPIEAHIVAHSMFLSATSICTGINIYESDQIQAIHDAAK